MKKILISSAVAVLLLTGCGEDKKEASTQVTQEVQKEVVKIEEPKVVEPKAEETTKEVVTQAAKDIASTVSKAAEDVSKTVSVAATKVAEDTSKAMDEKMPEVKEAVNATIEKTKVVVADVTKEATKVVEDMTKTEAPATAEPSVDGKALYASCAGCHGQSAEKIALGKSAVIKGWDKQKLIDALKGYKDGSYGGAMKAVMLGQVATKSDAEIEALADYISKL